MIKTWEIWWFLFHPGSVRESVHSVEWPAKLAESICRLGVVTRVPLWEITSGGEAWFLVFFLQTLPSWLSDQCISGMQWSRCDFGFFLCALKVFFYITLAIIWEEENIKMVVMIWSTTFHSPVFFFLCVAFLSVHDLTISEI